MLNKVQKAAYDLIQADARFIYTLVFIEQNEKTNDNNFLLMSQPYIGIFADGAEQWGHKLKLKVPNFTNIEKKYYVALRQSHKLYKNSYYNFSHSLISKFNESDSYFRKIRNPQSDFYYNVGVDLCNGNFCGNTILCALYNPLIILNNKKFCLEIQDISVVLGKLANSFVDNSCIPYNYNSDMLLKSNDYHFYNVCPLKHKSDLDFVLFSILCSINYTIKFIDQYFVDEIPQKFKYAYLQYYYLCDFIKDLNSVNGSNFYINDSMKNKDFRNCLAHYGLGQYISEEELINDDILKGLTNKAFNMNYLDAKKQLYKYLTDLIAQIEKEIF